MCAVLVVLSDYARVCILPSWFRFLCALIGVFMLTCSVLLCSFSLICLSLRSRLVRSSAAADVYMRLVFVFDESVAVLRLCV